MYSLPRLTYCSHFSPFLRSHFLALAGVAQWIEHRLQTKGLPVRFPVKAHAWVEGQVHSGSHMRGNHTLIFLPLYPPLPLSLKVNK